MSSRTRGRRVLFTLLALAIPVLLLGGAEVALLLAGKGALEPLFIRHPAHPEWSLANPRVVERFFTSPAQAPQVSIETGYFRTRKVAGALRLVVQGGSSAAGFPFGYGASVAGMLEQRLRREFPEREIEVVTTAMAAINSYALLDFTDEILAIQPDAVLIYAGHNEFLGVLGVGSAYRAARSPPFTRLILTLRRSRLYRTIETLLAPGAAPAGGGDEGTLMARVAAERRIPLDSPLYRAGVAQFESNLERLLARYRQAGIAVLIATLVSNERDHAPFASSESPAASARLQASAAALTAGRVAEAEALARTVVEAHPGSALARYRLAAALARANRDAEALQEWQAARDLDELRFRAPTRFGQIIREAAERSAATLVDAEARFRERSPHAAVGAELMLEHLHPNVDGYFLLADAFHDALLARGLPGDATRAVADDVARREVPLSRAEELFGQYKLMRLMNDWPFTDGTRATVLPTADGLEARLAQALYRRELDWPRMQDRLKQAYRAAGDRDEYLRLALILADAFPFVAVAQRDAGEALLERRRTVQAVRYLHRAVTYAPADVQALESYAEAAEAAGLMQEARRAQQRLRESGGG